jgi:hypothetical protein
MTSHERVERVMRGERADRVPLDTPAFFTQFRDNWAAYKGLPARSLEDHYGLDVWEVVADHSPKPSLARIIRDTPTECISMNGFGEVRREKPGGYYWEVLEVALKEKGDLDRFVFEDAGNDSRYAGMLKAYERHRERYWVRAKVGGPYSRSKWLRGEAQFLMDLVTDEPFVRELVGRVTDLMVAVGVESIRRLGLTTAMHIHDDFASLRGLFFSPDLYERIFLPAMQRMCAAFHAEGVKVIYGGEGRTAAVLPDLIGAGVDAFCCLEQRAGMVAENLRERLGDKVVFFGNLCNTVVLPRGTKEELRAMVLREMRTARRGRMLAGFGHSVSGEVPPENLDYVYELMREWGPYDTPLPAQ